MDKLNKYGFVSGGYIFDLLDRGALEHLNHKIPDTKNELWFTSRAEISYYRQICDIKDITFDYLFTGCNSTTAIIKATIIQNGEEAVVAEFYFKKANHNYCETKDKK